jgi:NAD(P)-dependent dehydrogenase (short-subunit alcohol dehydrogenase family)
MLTSEERKHHQYVVSSRCTWQYAGQCNYAASKAGLIALAKSIAQEIGSRNIRANAIAPGFIETAMTASLPEDIRAKNG